MDLREAIDWLEGGRSMVNIITREDMGTWDLRIAQADAAMTQIAWIVYQYHKANEYEKLAAERKAPY